MPLTRSDLILHLESGVPGLRVEEVGALGWQLRGTLEGRAFELRFRTQQPEAVLEITDGASIRVLRYPVDVYDHLTEGYPDPSLLVDVLTALAKRALTER